MESVPYPTPFDEPGIFSSSSVPEATIEYFWTELKLLIIELQCAGYEMERSIHNNGIFINIDSSLPRARQKGWCKMEYHQETWYFADDQGRVGHLENTEQAEAYIRKWLKDHLP